MASLRFASDLQDNTLVVRVLNGDVLMEHRRSRLAMGLRAAGTRNCESPR